MAGASIRKGAKPFSQSAELNGLRKIGTRPQVMRRRPSGGLSEP